MKKVLALFLVFALFTISATAQNEKTENLRRHMLEQRMYNRDLRLKHQGLMNQRRQTERRQLMRQHMMRNKTMHQGEARKMRQVQLQHRRKIMLRRHYMHRRVI